MKLFIVWTSIFTEWGKRTFGYRFASRETAEEFARGHAGVVWIEEVLKPY